MRLRAVEWRMEEMDENAMQISEIIELSVKNRPKTLSQPNLPLFSITCERKSKIGARKFSHAKLVSFTARKRSQKRSKFDSLGTNPLIFFYSLTEFSTPLTTSTPQSLVSLIFFYSLSGVYLCAKRHNQGLFNFQKINF